MTVEEASVLVSRAHEREGAAEAALVRARIAHRGMADQRDQAFRTKAAVEQQLRFASRSLADHDHALIQTAAAVTAAESAYREAEIELARAQIVLAEAEHQVEIEAAEAAVIAAEQRLQELTAA